MSSTATQVRLPVQFEKIHVLFRMPDGKDTWWETTVDNLQLQATDRVRAIASVTFTEGTDGKGNTYASETGQVHFLTDNKLILISNHSSFDSGTETLWSFTPGQSTEAAHSPTVRQRPRRDRKASAKLKASQIKTEPTLQKASTSTTHKNSQQRSPILSQRKARSGTTVLGKRRRQTQQQPAAIQCDSSENDSTDRLGSLENANAIHSINSMYNELKLEVTALQKQVAALQANQVSRAHSARTEEKRLFLEHELKRQVKRMATGSAGEKVQKFSSALKRCPFEFSIDCALHDFSNISNDINNKHSNSVRFLPSLPNIQNECQPLSQKHIVFNTYSTLLEWLGIIHPDEVSTFTSQTCRRKGKKALRILGGATWDSDDDERSLCFFMGSSCIRQKPKVKVEDVIEISTTNPSSSVIPSPPCDHTNSTQCMFLASTKWDNDSASFKDTFCINRSPTLFQNISMKNIFEYDAFTISWKPLPGLRSHDIYKSVQGQTKIIPGKLVIYIPAVLFNGDSICATVTSLMNSNSS